MTLPIRTIPFTRGISDNSRDFQLQFFVSDDTDVVTAEIRLQNDAGAATQILNAAAIFVRTKPPVNREHELEPISNIRASAVRNLIRDAVDIRIQSEDGGNRFFRVILDPLRS